MVAPPDADVVVLAAGRSSRLGSPKGLVAWRGRPWLEAQLDAIRDAAVRRVVLVLSPENEPSYRSAIPALDSRCVVTRNEEPARGPFSSLQCGLSRVAPGAPAFVLPVDVPAAGTEVWQALAGALGEGVDAVIPALEDRGGHPVLLHAALVAHVLALSPLEGRLDEELRARAALRPGSVVRVPVRDGRVRWNLNTREDWERLELEGRT
jgi:molybdenum cofactor cytidylyltransferase